MKIRSAIPENGCLMVLVDGKKTKKNQKMQKKQFTSAVSPQVALSLTHW